MPPSADRPFERRSESPSPEIPPRAEPVEPNGQRSAARRWDWLGSGPVRLSQALVFGLIFGFLLQKGGVAKFDILVGVLLLEEFTVVKVMLAAIIVGMPGVYLLHRLGVLELQIKETVYGSNILGGLIFGVGFGLIAYCPGTDAAAIGQGNYDALTGVMGMVFGSYLFALASNFTRGTVTVRGQRGKITLPELVGLSPGVFIVIAVPALSAVLVLLELFAPR